MCLTKLTSAYNYILHYNLRNWYLISIGTSQTAIKTESLETIVFQFGVWMKIVKHKDTQYTGFNPEGNFFSSEN